MLRSLARVAPRGLALFALALVVHALLSSAGFVPRGLSAARAQNAPAPNNPGNADNPGNAENAGNAPAANADRQSLGMTLIVKSGWIGAAFYVVLFAFAVVATMVVIERLVNLRRAKLAPDGFIQRLRELLAEREDAADDFRQLCDKHPSAIARVLKAGVLRAGRPLPEVEKAMEDAVAREHGRLRARVTPLAVSEKVAPLVGLFGTVVGMIFCFNIASETGLGAGEELAANISLALFTTAGGLLIAIPAALFNAWFKTKGDGYLALIDDVLMETMPSFARMEQGGAGERTGAGGPLEQVLAQR